jgi:hypothetical protein
MKIVLIDFENVGLTRQHRKNVATVRITEPKVNEGVAQLHSIRFKYPVHEIGGGELTELSIRVDAALNEARYPAGSSKTQEVAAAAASSMVSSKGVHGFAAFVKNMLAGKRRHMSPEDQKLADDALTMVDKLLGKGK